MPPFASTMWVLVIVCFATDRLAHAARVPQQNGLQGGGMPETPSRAAKGLVGAVAADDGRCSIIGRDIMAEQGGNAVDATVAVAFCQGVVNPHASGIGGGAFLLFSPANSSSPLAYDFREVAPGAASEVSLSPSLIYPPSCTRLAHARRNGIGSKCSSRGIYRKVMHPYARVLQSYAMSLQNMYNGDSDLKDKGALSVAVPGELAGLHLLWHQYGTLPWKTLMEPAIQLAKDGFEVSLYLAEAIYKASANILANEGLSEVFAPNGTLLVAGDTCVCTALAATLTSIALDGPSVFYNGSIGKNFIDDLTNAGGIMTTEDLAAYRVEIRDPIEKNIQGFTVYGMPPPSSGGACLLMVLNILAAYPDPFQAVMGPLGLHRMVEAIKHSFALRMNLGDPDFVDVTDVLTSMLNATFAAELQKLINDNRTYPPPYYGHSWRQLEDHGTTHFNVVDRDRNVVSMTSTVNYPFGAKILSKSTGVIMNNEMGDFSIPSNSSGGTPPLSANFIQAYKRPLSSMAPTIVMKDGNFVGALGGSGGVRIITATIQGFLNSFWKGFDPLTSVSSPRLHHQLMPDSLEYEDWTTVEGELIEEPEEVVEYLESKGHNMTSHSGAIVQLIVQNLTEPLTLHGIRSRRVMRGVEPWIGTLTAVSDLRKDGYAAAY